jgi:hypothetical protein
MSKTALLFSIDLRSLALFRIVMGCLLLADLAIRSQDLAVHYTDQGVLPLAALQEHPHGRMLSYLSLHFLHGSEAWALLLFVLAASCAFALMLGFRTRTAAFASWVLLLSLQHRNPLVVYGGDNFLAVVLFWCLFVPLGARWSLDARAGRGSDASTALSWGSVGLLVQIAAVHWFSAFHKRSAEWYLDGTAVAYALHLDHLVRPLGLVLREHDLVLRLITHGTIALELIGPLLLFSPWRPVLSRMLAIAGFVGLHLGIGFTLALLHFSWICAATMVVYLPPWFWDEGLPRLRRGLGLSRGAVPSAGSGEGYTGRLSRPARAVAAGALAFVLGWNTLSTHPAWRRAAEEQPVLQALMLPWQLLRLGQVWMMFSPHPPLSTPWNVVEGRLADGRRVDLLWGRPVPPRFEEPERPQDYYPSGRWERIFANASTSEYAYPYRSLASYYCRSWPAEDRLAVVSFYARRRDSVLGGRGQAGPPRGLVRFDCLPSRAGAAAVRKRSRPAAPPR